MQTLSGLVQSRPALQLAVASLANNKSNLTSKSFLHSLPAFGSFNVFKQQANTVAAPPREARHQAATCMRQQAPQYATTSDPLPSFSPSSQKRVFTKFAVYKGKAALNVTPMKAAFVAKNGGLVLDREGALLLEFAPAISARNYDWNKKQTFALSVLECGALLDLHPGMKPLDFFHDPFKGQPGQEGKVRKKLNIQTSHNDDGYFVGLNVSGQQAGNLSIPVSYAEMAVLKTLIQYSIPTLMGWDVWCNPDLAAGANVVEEGTQLGGAQEWNQ